MVQKAVIRLPEVKARTGISRASIYSFEKQNKFPKRVKLGSRAVGWIESEIEAWIEARVKACRPAAE